MKNLKYKVILSILFILVIFTLFAFQSIYAAEAKIYITPTNPRVGDTFSVRAEITGNDAYSINIINLDESTNLEYITMDLEKKASGTTPLKGFVEAKYKVKEYGTGWISLKYKIESATLVNKKLDLGKITSKTFEKKVDVKIVPDVTGIEKIDKKYEVTDNDVNIRPHPSTTYSSLGVYQKGKEVDVTGKSGDWFEFTYKDAKAYIHKNFVKEIIKEDEIIEQAEEEIIEDDEEEITDPLVLDPRQPKNRIPSLIITALIIGAALIAALIYLFKQGPENNKEQDLKYGKQNDEERF